MGGGGGDFLVGGAGADTFAYASASDSTTAAADLIYNFDPAKNDLIDLRTLDGGLGAHFVTSFDGHAGEYEVTAPTAASSYWHLDGDLTGAGQAGFEIAFSVVGAMATLQAVEAHILL